MKRHALTGLFILLALGIVFAQDFNGMSEDQVQAYIAEQVQQQVQAQQQQPQIITTQLDEQTRVTLTRLDGTINELTGEISSLKTSNEQMNLRFAQMSEHFDTQLEDLLKQVKGYIDAQLSEKLPIETQKLMDYVYEVTNPVRMNLPAIAVFGMLTAVFLLWLSRYYQPKGKRPRPEPEKIREPELITEKPKPQKWVKLPVKVSKKDDEPALPKKAGMPVQDEEEIMKANLPLSQKIKLLEEVNRKDG